MSLGNTSKEIQGFTLGKSGLASTINNPRYHYEKWKLKNECLIIEGKLITDSCFVPLSDTLYIKYIDKKQHQKGTFERKIRICIVFFANTEIIGCLRTILPSNIVRYP